jgi:Fe-S cluster biogenesis protein NfuA
MAALRRKRDDRAAVEARIREALGALRTILQIDAFEAELVEFREESGLAVLRVGGGCADCDLHAARFAQGIEAHLRTRVVEVREVLIQASDAAGEAGHPT